MANTEDIEAKLCAYVDGELDAGGRAEIERHLSTNPQHRRLIDELVQQRDLVRALPRARAPLDVAESLNAQLERAALLNVDEWDQRSMRISRWPQLRAAAAILLLVGGLAAVVYYVIPSPNPQPHGTVAMNEPTATAADRVPTEVAPAPGPNPAAPGGSMGIGTSTVFTADGTPDDAAFTGGSERDLRPLIALGSAIPQSHSESFATNAVSHTHEMMMNALGGRDGSTEADQAGRESGLVVEVVAADPFAAQQQVEAYLQTNQFAYKVEDAAAAPAPLELDPSQRAMGSRMAQRNVELRREGPSADAGLVAPDEPNEKVEQKDKLTEPLVKEATLEDAQRGGEQERRQASEPAPQARFRASGLTRRDVDTLCNMISAQTGGQVLQTAQSTAAAAPMMAPPGPELLSSIDSWNFGALFPWKAQSRARDGATSVREYQLSLVPPTTQPQGEERLDVTIVFRADVQPPTVEPAQPAQQERASPPQDAPADQPTTSPTTEPTDR